MVKPVIDRTAIPPSMMNLEYDLIVDAVRLTFSILFLFVLPRVNYCLVPGPYPFCRSQLFSMILLL